MASAVDAIPEDILGCIFTFFGHRELRHFPAAGRGVLNACLVRTHALWRPGLAGNGLKHLADEDRDQLQTALCPKDAVRVYVYMARHHLVSRSAALQHAATANDVAVLDLLLAAGADPNMPADPAEGCFSMSASRLPLHAAAKRGHCESLVRLLDAGADVDTADATGLTGLMLAVASGQATMAELLLTHGASAERASHYGFTALHYAASRMHHEIAEQLLKHSARPDRQDSEGKTPLHIAMAMLRASPGEWEDVVRTAAVLLAAGADLKVRDNYGRTALDLLDRDRCPEVCKWLGTHCLRIRASQAGSCPFGPHKPGTLPISPCVAAVATNAGQQKYVDCVA